MLSFEETDTQKVKDRQTDTGKTTFPPIFRCGGHKNCDPGHSAQAYLGQNFLSLVYPFSNKPWLLRVCITSLENTVRKGEIARNEQFLLFQLCFLPFQRTFFHFHQIQNCRLQNLSVWKSLKFVVWERVNFLYFKGQEFIFINHS